MSSTSRFRRTFVSAAVIVAVAAAPALAALRGPDVSSWNHGGAISWQAVKNSGSSFVFIKATEGTGYTNPYFARDWRNSGAARLLHGAYHFARPSSRAYSATTQARHYVRVMGGRLQYQSLPPVLDLEVSGGLSPPPPIAWAPTRPATGEKITSPTPLIYNHPALSAQRGG